MRFRRLFAAIAMAGVLLGASSAQSRGAQASSATPAPTASPAQPATSPSVADAPALAANNAGRPSAIPSGTWHSASDPSVPKGYAAGESQELPAHDTVTTRTFMNPDGTMTTNSYHVPVNYLGTDGAYHHVDPTVVTRPDGSLHNAAGADDMRFGGSGDPQVLSESDGTHSVAFDAPSLAGSPAQAAHPSPHASANSLTYSDVLPALDLKYVVASDGIKELIVLKQAPAGAGDVSLTFPLRLSGLTASQSGQAIEFKDSKGTLVYTLAPGVMGDSNVDPKSGNAPSAPVSYTEPPREKWRLQEPNWRTQWASQPNQRHHGGGPRTRLK